MVAATVGNVVMPSPDTKLDLLLEELSTIHVPSVVQFLIKIHDKHCPIEIAARTVEELVIGTAGRYNLNFDD